MQNYRWLDAISWRTNVRKRKFANLAYPREESITGHLDVMDEGGKTPIIARKYQKSRLEKGADGVSVSSYDMYVNKTGSSRSS